MITHNTVSQEAKKIKEILDEGDLIIPGFYKCFWPCLAFVIWMVVWPFIAFCVFGDLQDEAFLLMGFLGFFGFGMSLIIFNARSLYLSLPLTFRKDSKIISMLKGKILSYFFIFIALNVLTGLFMEKSKSGLVFYTFITVGCLSILAVIFGADISRYRLSAFTSALELIKSRKKGGEE